MAKGGGADEDHACVVHGLREVRVLGQEAVAGMDRVRAALLRDLEDAIDTQVALRGDSWAEQIGLVGEAHVQRGAIHVGVDGHRLVTELLAGADDAYGDLAAIGDQDLHGRRSKAGEEGCECLW